MFKIRKASESDIPFIFSTWLKGLYYGNETFREIDKGIYFSKYHDVISALLRKSEIKVAYSDDGIDEDVILGYSVSQGARLHWVHVKEEWRKTGIAGGLVASATNSCSHITKVGNIIRKKRGWIFDPFL